MRKINNIILHCSATREGQNTTVADIERWHKERGFRTIGYHYVIYLDGSVHKGRDVSEVGAHVTGQNADSIGICYIGGLNSEGKEKDTRTDAQKESLRKLVTELKGQFPDATVHGHNEFAKKACPCFDVKKEFES
ncbi:MAG: N-acetylmuramoyl-L-alanine amidase [Prevotellaceae bacterium]|jgi:N-acetylmuramoyl-L-alanine amidase|nr:N-acetylmuramoyl-L-alanine amidase [Prevotellaceae bacterium]